MPTTGHDAGTELQQLFSRWIKRTDEVLHHELNRRGIGVSDDLDESIKSEMAHLAEGYLEGRFSFLVRGRFVDMGAGRGYTAGGNRTGSELGDRRSKRKPKQWYSRPFFGRLNDLEGAVGFAIMEQAIDSIVQPLKSAGNG